MEDILAVKPAFWQTIVEGGPIIVALHFFMLVCFIASLRWSVSHVGGTASLLLAVGPFVFGSIAMWLAIVGLLAVMGGQYEGDLSVALCYVQRPFFLGSGFSAVAVTVHLIARASKFNNRNAQAMRHG